jgi:hypothetical protein
MKDLEVMIDEIRDWYNNGGVGNVLMFRSPRASQVDCIYEETIKLFELDRESRGLVDAVFEVFDAEKMEFYRSPNGQPDRVKITRRG